MSRAHTNIYHNMKTTAYYGRCFNELNDYDPSNMRLQHVFDIIGR